MATAVNERLPLLHKYVLQPQDDMQLVMTKLNFRLCVKEVSKVIHRRSLGASISEAINFDSFEEARMMSSHQMVEPLVLSSKDVESPQLLSPDDSGYCGTMKSDDSGIVMDDSQMNFSGDQSDLMYSSTEVSPLEEDNSILCPITQSSDRPLSGNVPCFEEVEENVCVTVTEQEHRVNTQVANFFQREDTPEALQEAFKTTGDVPNSWEDLESSEDEDEAEQSEGETIEEVTEVMVLDTEEGPVEDTLETAVDDTPLDDDDSLTQDAAATEEPEIKQKVEEDNTEILPTIEVTEESTDDISEEQMEEEISEEQQQEEKEEERVQFVKGLRCDDVQTALTILKTHYKLSDTSVRKFIITFSSWNVSQFSHPISKRCSWWDESKALPVENPEVEDLMEEIYTRQGEISELVDRIMEEEKLKQDLVRHLEASAHRTQPAAEPEIVVTAASSPSQTAPPATPEIVSEEPEKPAMEKDEPEASDEKDEDQPEENDSPKDDNHDESNNKKKRRNALQRFLHAMRKRMARNSRPPTEKDRVKA